MELSFVYKTIGPKNFILLLPLLRGAMPNVLRQWFVGAMNLLTSFVVANQFQVLIIGTVDQSLMLNYFSERV